MANKDYRKDFQIIKLKSLAKVTGMDYRKLRNCIKGDYASWDDQDQTRIYNSLREEVEKACAALGFTYEGRRIRRLKD